MAIGTRVQERVASVRKDTLNQRIQECWDGFYRASDCSPW